MTFVGEGRMRSLCAALAVLVFAVSAAAQAPNPVMEHYRAYNAAMQRGDLAAAEDAAAQALAASEARDGDGGSTAALAANLAQVRLDRGRVSEALAPAQRALQLARANANAGVDPIYAGLLLGRAELPRAGQGEPSLVDAVAAAERAGGFEAEIYDAASALGQWAIQRQRYAIGVSAYEAAIRASSGDDDGQVIARANAHVGRGVALLLGDRGRQFGTQRGSSGQATRLIDRPNEEAPRAMLEAVRLLTPLMERGISGPQLTRVQAAYASASSWQFVTLSWFRSMGWRVPPDARDFSGQWSFDLEPDDRKPACQYRLVAEPLPEYPANALADFGVGATMLRIVTGPDGQAQEMNVIAGAGGQMFIDAVQAAAPRWRVARRENTPPDCSARVLIFQMFYFRFE